MVINTITLTVASFIQKGAPTRRGRGSEPALSSPKGCPQPGLPEGAPSEIDNWTSQYRRNKNGCRVNPAEGGWVGRAWCALGQAIPFNTIMARPSKWGRKPDFGTSPSTSQGH